MVTEDLTLGSEYIIQYVYYRVIDDVLQNYTPETYIIALNDGTPINSIKGSLAEDKQ